MSQWFCGNGAKMSFVFAEESQTALKSHKGMIHFFLRITFLDRTGMKHKKAIRGKPTQLLYYTLQSETKQENVQFKKKHVSTLQITVNLQTFTNGM